MRRLVGAVALATGLALTPQPAQAMPEGAVGTWDVPVIKVYAPTSKTWRVTKAIRSWRTALPAGMTMVAVSQDCSGCIRVREVATMPPGYEHASGIAWWSFKYDDNMVVRMDHCDIDVVASTPRPYRRAVTAHEIGHCLGLEHADQADHSIMRPGIADVREVGILGPTVEDLSWLARAYTIPAPIATATHNTKEK